MRFSLRWGFIHWVGFYTWVGSILRLWGLWYSNRWYDEIFTSWSALLPFERMVAATAGDVHPPGYYALVWLVAHLTGSNAVWLLRLPSALLSIAAIPLLAQIGRRLKLSDTAILWAVAFMALSQFQIYYGQETRMYALLQLEVLGAVLAVLERRWWLLAVCASAMLWTHNYGAIYCALIFLVALVQEIRMPVTADPPGPVCNLPALIGSGAAALLSYMPWVPTLIRQLRAVGNWWQQPTTPGGFLEPIQQFVWGNPLGILTPISQVLVFALVAFATFRAVRLRLNALVPVMAFAPMLISVATEWVGMHPTYLYRTFIGSSGFLYLLIGWGLDTVKAAQLRRLTLAAVAPMFAISTLLYYPVVKASKGATDDFILAVASQAQPGDFIYHMNPGSLMAFREKYPDQPERYMWVHPAMPNDIGTLSSPTLAAFGVHQVELEDIPWRRAWLIFSAGPTLGTAEDAEVLRLVDEFHGQPLLDYSLWFSKIYRGQIWLLKR